MKKTLSVSVGISTLLTFPLLCMAFERDHNAHEHGHAKLMIAVEHEEVAIELHSPAINIVGFEHVASSHQDKEKLELAENQLQQANTLFSFNQEADCVLEHVKVSSALLEHHDEKENSHDKEHHHKSNDTHQKEHDENEESHSEFEVSYHYECSSTEALKTLTVSLFEYFPSFEEIEVQLISSSEQKLVELDSSNTVIEF